MVRKRQNRVDDVTEWLLLLAIALMVAWAAVDDGFGSGWESREKRVPEAPHAPNATGCAPDPTPSDTAALKAAIERVWQLKEWA